MKTLLISIFILIIYNSYAQKLNCENISNYSLWEIYDELIIDNKYTLVESEELGKRFSEIESNKGIRRILTYQGLFTTGCLKCIYHKFGFKTHEFAQNDLIYENIDAFTHSYNSVMNGFLSNTQKAEIDNFDFNCKHIFSSYLTSLNQYKAEKLSDSIVNFKIQSDTLEFLFHSDIKHLIVKIGNSKDYINAEEFKYEDLKTNGTDINIDSASIISLYICFDFSRMPNRYNICWCDILEQKYKMILPLKIE